MSKYYDLEKIEGYLERIVIAVEKIAEIEEPYEEVKEEKRLKQVEYFKNKK